MKPGKPINLTFSDLGLPVDDTEIGGSAGIEMTSRMQNIIHAQYDIERGAVNLLAPFDFILEERQRSDLFWEMYERNS
jgi:hypothetical protein